MPLNIAGLEGLAAAGFDLLGQHRADFPPEYLAWIDACRAMTAGEAFADHAMRTEVYDAIQGVFATYDLLSPRPSPACRSRTRRTATRSGPATVGRRGGRPADRLVPDLSDQLHRPSRGVGPGRAVAHGPAGRHADRRAPLCRSRRPGGQRNVRTAAALDRHLSRRRQGPRLTPQAVARPRQGQIRPTTRCWRRKTQPRLVDAQEKGVLRKPHS